MVLNLFELLRFRLFSSWIDTNIPKEMETNRMLKKLKPALILAAKSVVNIALLLVWIFFVLFRNFWYRFRFECSQTNQKVSKHRDYLLALTIAIRAQLIKACTEASLQPLFQVCLLSFKTLVFISVPWKFAKFRFVELTIHQKNLVHQIDIIPNLWFDKLTIRLMRFLPNKY